MPHGNGIAHIPVQAAHVNTSRWPFLTSFSKSKSSTMGLLNLSSGKDCEAGKCHMEVKWLIPKFFTWLYLS